jgi:hypothetical protein
MSIDALEALAELVAALDSKDLERAHVAIGGARVALAAPAQQPVALTEEPPTENFGWSCASQARFQRTQTGPGTCLKWCGDRIACPTGKPLTYSDWQHRCVQYTLTDAPEALGRVTANLQYISSAIHPAHQAAFDDAVALIERLAELAQNITLAHPAAPSDAQPAQQALDSFLQQTREVLTEAAKNPGKAFELPEAVVAEYRKFMRDEPSLFDQLKWGDVNQLASLAAAPAHPSHRDNQ